MLSRINVCNAEPAVLVCGADVPRCSQQSSCLAARDSECGSENLSNERQYFADHRNDGIQTHFVRYDNIFALEGTRTGGRGMSPTMLWRKVASAGNKGNNGCEEMVTSNQLVDLVADTAGQRIHKKRLGGQPPVRGRNADNGLPRELLVWEPSEPLRPGLGATCAWIDSQARASEVALVA